MKFISLFVFLLSSGCGATKKTIPPTVIYSACSLEQEKTGICSRFMDRDIYFVDNGSVSSSSFNVKNNPLDIEKVKSSIKDFACNTELGCNYFIFHSDTQENLKPITGYTTGKTFKSFIQVWPDTDFAALYTEMVPNSNEPNAIVLYNPNNRKQFYMILKGSCLSESSNVNCTNNPGTIFTSDLGLTALIARNFGRIVGIPLESNDKCVATPLSPNVMCGRYPSNLQWSFSEKNKMTSLFNNALEVIALNSEYYTQTFLENL